MDNNSNEPIVLGTLRKEKSSKPIFVFVVLALIIGTTFALPYIQSYVNNPNTFLGALYYKYFKTPEPNYNPIIPNEEDLHILNEETTIYYRTILLSNITLDNKTISYNLKVRTSSLDLNDGNYYLEIYGSAKNLMERIKLTGNLTTENNYQSFTFNNFNFNKNINYYGKIIELKDENYEELILNSDESGLASITCIDSKNKFEYIFENHLLKYINHYYEYKDISQIDIYLEEFQKYSQKSALINNLKSDSAKTEENDQGFLFTAKIDLSVMNKTDLGMADNIYYYNLDKPAKIINYDMKVQGFKCN